MSTTSEFFNARQSIQKAVLLLTLIAPVLLLASPACAHDFWVEPEKFRPSVGERVPIGLRVGEHWKGEPVLYLDEKIVRFVVAGPNGEQKITGKPGDDPAGSIAVGEAGLYIVGYHSKKFDVSFDSFDKFEKYLLLEGLEQRVEPARKRFNARNSILENYSRYAKSLIGVGDAKGQPDRALGFPFELLAENNPYRDGRKMSVRLLYQGKPIEGVLAVASNKENPMEKIKIRTDKDGRAVFQLNKSGAWLINAVHLIPTSVLSSADWESFWASLTFELP